MATRRYFDRLAAPSQGAALVLIPPASVFYAPDADTGRLPPDAMERPIGVQADARHSLPRTMPEGARAPLSRESGVGRQTAGPTEPASRPFEPHTPASPWPAEAAPAVADRTVVVADAPARVEGRPPAAIPARQLEGEPPPSNAHGEARVGAANTLPLRTAVPSRRPTPLHAAEFTKDAAPAKLQPVGPPPAAAPALPMAPPPSAARSVRAISEEPVLPKPGSKMDATRHAEPPVKGIEPTLQNPAAPPPQAGKASVTLPLQPVQGRPSIHIGVVEVHVAPPRPTPAPPQQPRQTIPPRPVQAGLARGLGSRFGLGQS